MMKSGISFFDWGLSKSLLRRFWPIWLCYFGTMLFILPLGISGRSYIDPDSIHEYILYSVYSCTQTAVIAAFIVSAVLAMAMFGHLYDTRACGMINSLPLRRETVFSTAFLTGLMPLLAANVLAALVCAVTAPEDAGSILPALMKWFAAVSLIDAGFFGFATFCAMLTGSVLIMPLVYLVLNVAAWMAEGCIRRLLSAFVYGMPMQGNFFDWLSPVITLMAKMGAVRDEMGAAELCGMGTAAAYCAAGLAFAALALLLYKGRSMETAGDTVAIPVLRPVFKYCMCFGGAVVFACAMYTYSLVEWRGLSAALIVLALLLVGAFLGYFMACMIIQKSLKVFSGGWRGYIISACVITALLLGWEFDLTGYEKRLPEAENVVSVHIYGDINRLTEPDSIQRVIELHRQIVEHKRENEAAESVCSLRLLYELSDGSTMQREFDIAFSEEELYREGSELSMVQELVNLPEAVRSRCETVLPMREENIYSAAISGYIVDEKGEYYYSSTRITAAQAVELYEGCILPDIEDGNIGNIYLLYGDEAMSSMSGTTVSISLAVMGYDRNGVYVAIDWDHFYIDVEMGAERTVSWIESNTDMKVLPRAVTGANDMPVMA